MLAAPLWEYSKVRQDLAISYIKGKGKQRDYCLQKCDEFKREQEAICQN